MSKALGIKSRIDFFPVVKHLTKFVKQVDIQTSIAPNHNTIFLLLSWPYEHPHRLGFWKFNNTLLNDEDYTSTIQELYPELCQKNSYVSKQQLFWELMKMEIRTTTISFAKGKAQTIKKCETVIKEQLDELDKKICNSQNPDNIDPIFKQYDGLKKELQRHFDNKDRAAIFRSKCRWVENGKKATTYFFNLEKRNDNGKIFSANPKLCKQNKLKEFQFKFIDRIVVTKKELFRYGIHTDSDCTYCSEPDSIDHTFINCTFTLTFAPNVIDWFNVQNGSSFQPDTREMLFSSCKYPNNPASNSSYSYFV